MGINDGGYMFPQLLKAGELAQSSGGMSRRQWYAGLAMQAIITARGNVPIADYDVAWNERVANEAFAQADAMIEADALDAGR